MRSKLVIKVDGTPLTDSTTPKLSDVKVYANKDSNPDKTQEKTTALTAGTYWLCVPNGGADGATTDFKITVSDDSGNQDTAISSITLTGLTADGLKVGQTVPANNTLSVKDCTIEDVTWTKDGGKVTAGTNKFAAGDYKAVVVVKTTNAKGFADAVKNNISFGSLESVSLDESADATKIEASSGEQDAVKDKLTFTLNVTIAKEKLTSLAITGLSEPESSSTTITENDVKLSPDDEAKYSIKTKPTSWTESSGTFTTDITFEITTDVAKNYEFDTKNVSLSTDTFTKGSATAEVKGTATATEVTFTITYKPTSTEP